MSAGNTPFDVRLVRADFPALSQKVHGKDLVYLDNASTTQVPDAVIEAVARVGRGGRANVHRGLHELSARATEHYETARRTVQHFLNAAEDREIIFVRGATEGLNLIARSFGASRVQPGDEVLITTMEHHSNIVPWQMLCQERGAKLSVVPVTAEVELLPEEVEQRLGPKTRLLAVTHVSNATGTVNPIRTLAELAHARGIPLVVDGAQAVPHLPVDVQALGADFYVFSGHKLFGPTGIGVVYGRAEFLEAMPPFLGGGDMIKQVSFDESTYADIPRKFEAGTPNLEGAVGLCAAIDYLNRFNREAIEHHEQTLLTRLTERILALPGFRVFGHERSRIGILSLTMDGVHPHDIGTYLDRQGIAVRTGHHCAEPLMRHLGVPATVRISLALYNTVEEVDALVSALEQAQRFFSR